MNTSKTTLQQRDPELNNYKYISEESTHHHASMVAAIAEILAKKQGFSPEDVSLIRDATMLHDIGKNFVPDEILNKPGKLTAEEFAVIKTHADLGFEYLISQIRILMLGAILALHHHERIDGNGYNHIPAENIHPIAKLVAVADVFDALCSQRPYKEPFPPEKAEQMIQIEKGAHFEPEYVDLLISSMSEILTLYKTAIPEQT